VYFVVGDGGNEEGPSDYSGQADQVNGLPNCFQTIQIRTAACHTVPATRRSRHRQEPMVQTRGNDLLHHGSRRQAHCWGRDGVMVSAAAQDAPLSADGTVWFLESNHYGPEHGCCMRAQAWSAFREPSFGHGMLTLNDAATAQWRWNRNQDAGDAVVGDTVRSQPNPYF